MQLYLSVWLMWKPPREFNILAVNCEQKKSIKGNDENIRDPKKQLMICTMMLMCCRYPREEVSVAKWAKPKEEDISQSTMLGIPGTLGLFVWRFWKSNRQRESTQCGCPAGLEEAATSHTFLHFQTVDCRHVWNAFIFPEILWSRTEDLENAQSYPI